MKRFVLLCIIYYNFLSLYAYDEKTHQLIVQTSYKYLENIYKESGFNINDLQNIKNDIFCTASASYLTYLTEDNTSECSDKEIAFGAYDEDRHEVIFTNNPAFFSSGSIVSEYPFLAHFWNADLGNSSINTLENTSINTTWTNIPNAWMKSKIILRKIKNELVNYNAIMFQEYWCSHDSNWLCPQYIKENYFYRKSKLQQALNSYNKASVMLGRLIHILSDMSVPAHVHIDSHGPGDTDPYEDYWINNNISLLNHLFNTPNLLDNNAFVFTNNYEIDDIFLYNIFFTMNQLTDYFPSKDATANNNLPSGTNNLLNNKYQSWKNRSFSSSSNYEIASELLPELIPLVASVLYWFELYAGDAHLITNTYLALNYSNIENTKPLVLSATSLNDNSFIYNYLNKDSLQQNINNGFSNDPIQCSLYPNPTNNFLNIKIDGEDIYDIQLLSLNGYLLKENKNQMNAIQVFNLSTFSPGIYILKIQSKMFTKSYKVQKY